MWKMNIPQPSIIYYQHSSRYAYSHSWFIKNKHHILSACCRTNVIFPVAVHRSTENVITWHQNAEVVVRESLLCRLHSRILCEAQRNKSSFSPAEAWSSFTPYLWAGSQSFEWLWPLWPLLAPTGLQPSSCSSFQSSTLSSTAGSRRQEDQHPSAPKNWPPGQGHNTTGIIPKFPHEQWSMTRRREKGRKSSKINQGMRR